MEFAGCIVSFVACALQDGKITIVRAAEFEDIEESYRSSGLPACEERYCDAS